MKSRYRDYEVTFGVDDKVVKVNVEAENHLEAVSLITKEVHGDIDIYSVLLAKDTISPKWAKWAVYVGVANLVGQIALVIENLINLKGNGFV